MLLRNLITSDLHSTLSVIKRVALQIWTVVAGRAEVIGKRIGEKLMLGKGNLLSLFSMLTGTIYIILLDEIYCFINLIPKSRILQRHGSGRHRNRKRTECWPSCVGYIS